MSTQSSGAPRVLKDGGHDQRESQVELLLQRQIHRHTKTNTQNTGNGVRLVGVLADSTAFTWPALICIQITLLWNCPIFFSKDKI